MSLIENFIKETIQWLFPFILLALQIILKLFIGEMPSGIALKNSFNQIPIELGFLSLSFISASIIMKPDFVKTIIFVIYIIIFILMIAFWKLSPSNITRNDLFKSGFYTVINYLFAIGMIMYGIDLMTGV